MAEEEPEPLSEAYWQKLTQIRDANVEQLQQTLSLARKRRNEASTNDEQNKEVDEAIKLLKGVYKFLTKSINSLTRENAPSVEYVKNEVERALFSDIARGLWAEHRYAERQRKRREREQQREAERAAHEQHMAEEARRSREKAHERAARCVAESSHNRLVLLSSAFSQLQLPSSAHLCAFLSKHTNGKQAHLHTRDTSDATAAKHPGKAARTESHIDVSHTLSRTHQPQAVSLPAWRNTELEHWQSQFGTAFEHVQPNADPCAAHFASVHIPRIAGPDATQVETGLKLAIAADGSAGIDCTDMSISTFINAGFCNGTGVHEKASLSELCAYAQQQKL